MRRESAGRFLSASTKGWYEIPADEAPKTTRSIEVMN
jgi:hypothetical protein